MEPGSLSQIVIVPFEAIRKLNQRLHGHGFLARVVADQEPQALIRAWDRCVGCLDQGFLNDHMPLPNDVHLARWLYQCVRPSPPALIGIRSTQNRGIDLDQDNRAHFWYRTRFEAAHRLPHVAPDHPCGRMHGHGFTVTLHTTESLSTNATETMKGMDALVSVWQPLQAMLDKSCLNDLHGLDNPTSEVLAYWIWEHLKPQLPSLSCVTIDETATSSCQYDGETYHIGQQWHFESALYSADPDHRLHGHSYALQLHLSIPLDAVMGWTVDYGDVKKQFAPIYAQLDHHLLNDLPGLIAADLSRVAHWIWEQAQARLSSLTRLDLYETPYRGVSLVGSKSPLVLHPWPTR